MVKQRKTRGPRGSADATAHSGLPLARLDVGGGQVPPKMGFARPQAWTEVSQGELLIDDSESHVAVFAPTGAGKGRNFLIPLLLSNDQPTIVLDVKGELARTTARHRREAFGHKTYVLDPWGIATDTSDSFNPLDVLAADGPSLPDDAYALASLLIDPDGRSLEAFWDESSQALVAGLITYVVGTPRETDRSFSRVWKLMHGEDVVMDLAVTLDTVTDMPPFAYAQMAGHLQVTAEVTRAGILAVVRQHLRLFGSPLIQKAVTQTSLDLDLLRDGGPATLYIVVPPSKLRSHAALLRLWLSALMTLLTERQTAPRARTLLVLDEIAQLGRMDQVVQAVTLMRGYGLRCILMLQSYAQLKERYPKEHEVFLENCGTLLTFGHTAFGMSKQMADALGDISPEALFRMGSDQLAVRPSGQATQIARRLDYLSDPEFSGRFDPNPMHAASPNPRGANNGHAPSRLLDRDEPNPTPSL